ncbi:MAG TPA: hypothetical protein VGM42_09155, partial [Rhodopila sp.]
MGDFVLSSKGAPPSPVGSIHHDPNPSVHDWRGWAMTALPLICLTLGAGTLGGCGTLDRLSEVGRPPTMTPSEDPTKDPNWRPLTMPSPTPQPSPPQANALWRPGSRA